MQSQEGGRLLLEGNTFNCWITFLFNCCVSTVFDQKIMSWVFSCNRNAKKMRKFSKEGKASFIVLETIHNIPMQPTKYACGLQLYSDVVISKVLLIMKTKLTENFQFSQFKFSKSHMVGVNKSMSPRYSFPYSINSFRRFLCHPTI